MLSRCLGWTLTVVQGVREEGGRIVIEPIRSGIYDLDLLLADIPPENLHTEVSFGRAIGKETF
jgi:antitoxin MazE